MKKFIASLTFLTLVFVSALSFANNPIKLALTEPPYNMWINANASLGNDVSILNDKGYIGLNKRPAYPWNSGSINIPGDSNLASFSTNTNLLLKNKIYLLTIHLTSLTVRMSNGEVKLFKPKDCELNQKIVPGSYSLLVIWTNASKNTITCL